jgi:hypothetical protein
MEITERVLFKNGRRISRPGERVYEAKSRERRKPLRASFGTEGESVRTLVAEEYKSRGAARALHLARALPAATQRKDDDRWLGNQSKRLS